MSQQEPVILKSYNSRVKALVTVINMTERDISVEWLNGKGDHVPYERRLKPKMGMNLQTYYGHPWVFYDSDTRHTLVTSDGQRILFPARLSREQNPPRRQIVKITNPNLTLKEWSLRAVHRYLLRPEEINCVGLPWQLADALKELVRSQKLTNTPIYVYPAD